MRIFLTILSIMSTIAMANAKPLIAYYSYTNNIHRIATELSSQIEADVLRIEPAEKGLDYAANNYAIGSQQIAAIRANPDKESSYPPIDPITKDISQYDTIILAVPLWWSNMAAPFQTFLFKFGKQMAGKNIGLIVSSASSGISGVEADAHRLIPAGKFLSPSLWIRSSQTSSASSLLKDWLKKINYDSLASSVEDVIADNGEISEYYTLSGRKVGRVISDTGIYIKKSGSKAQKILIK